MDKKTPGHRRNERPNDVEEERSDKSGLKNETKSQGLKPDMSKVPEADPVDVDEDEDIDDDDEDEDDDAEENG